jgi:hypothetical protein
MAWGIFFAVLAALFVWQMLRPKSDFYVVEQRSLYQDDPKFRKALDGAYELTPDSMKKSGYAVAADETSSTKLTG